MNDYVKQIVDKLPALNLGEFPDLPKIPEGTTLVVFESEMGKAEKEIVLGLITTAAIRAGNWEPVGVDDFTDMLNAHTFVVNRQNVVNAAWEMASEKLLEIVTFEEKDYIIPSQKLAQMLSGSTLRVT